MSTRASGFSRSSRDHFVPDEDSDPQAARRLRGHLEHIDFTAYASDREMIKAALGPADPDKFQHLAVACAHARAQWLKEALAMAVHPTEIGKVEVQRLADLRMRYEEMAEVYDAMRLMVERGLLVYPAST